MIMAANWKLCPSSEPYLKRCIEAARPQTDANKWFKKFKKIPENSAENLKKLNEKSINDIVSNSDNNLEAQFVDKVENSPEISEDFYETIELEPILKFDFLVTECLKNPGLISKLAEKLSTGAIQKLCDHLFANKHANDNFKSIFFDIFFVALLKQDYSRFSLDLLIKANKAEPIKFKKVLKQLFKSLEINCNILHNFFEALEEHEKLIFMNKIIEIDLTTQELSHNLFTVLIAYKHCKKTQQIQNYIEKLLVENHDRFKSEKNFGKLLLAYLQEQKQNVTVKNFQDIEKVIETHQIPFRKPCLNVFNEILDIKK